ncbi:MAG: FAD-dependent monooxygenase [Chloroflexi bacterium]|nr:FAD-dependent monooxygenase [Chloroflexota bacterium]
MTGPDVLIIGAGPVGLALAGDLVRRGVSCRIVDSADHPMQQTKAVGIQARTLELLARMGAARAAIDRGLTTSLFSIYSGGKRLIRIDFREHLAESPYPYVLLLPQDQTEQVLTQHLRNLGTEVEWQSQLISLKQDGQGVEAVLRHADGHDERAAVGWLVGCDGAHSAVRHLLDLQFVGSTLEQSFATFAVGNVRMEWELGSDEVFAFLHQGNFIGYFPMAGGRHRVVVAYAPDSAPTGDVTLDEIQQAVDTCGPTRARALEPTELTRFHINQRRTERYRVGHVFLAGDAAHIHSPIGAQGMNTGIQDALNLSWKLALTISGRASAVLLDSYETERQQVGDALLRATDLTTHLALTRNPFMAWLRDALTPMVFASLPVAAHRLAQSLAEMNVAYPDGPISVERRDHGRSPHAGDRAPDGEVRAVGAERGQTLFDLLNTTQRSVLLMFTGDYDAATMERYWSEISATIASGYQDLIAAYVVTENTAAESEHPLLHDDGGALHERYDAKRGALILIRPDGYIGLAAELGAAESLRAYLHTLFIPAGAQQL